MTTEDDSRSRTGSEETPPEHRGRMLFERLEGDGTQRDRARWNGLAAKDRDRYVGAAYLTAMDYIESNDGVLFRGQFTPLFGLALNTMTGAVLGLAARRVLPASLPRSLREPLASIVVAAGTVAGLLLTLHSRHCAKWLRGRLHGAQAWYYDVTGFTEDERAASVDG